MGYHIVLLRSPPRAITWKQLSAAAKKLGWNTDDASREVRLTEGDRLAARVILGEEGEPWCKLMDETELGHVIALADALGARARGDEFESYRSVEETYQHPDDVAERDAARLLYGNTGAARIRRRLWDMFRIAVLVFLAVTVATRFTKG